MRKTLIVALAGGALTVSGCGSGSEPAAAGDTIKLGTLGDTAGMSCIEERGCNIRSPLRSGDITDTPGLVEAVGPWLEQAYGSEYRGGGPVTVIIYGDDRAGGARWTLDCPGGDPAVDWRDPDGVLGECVADILP